MTRSSHTSPYLGLFISRQSPLGEFTNDPLGLTIELDLFEGELAPLLLAEVEFPDEPSANAFTPPSWFGEDVTFSGKYHNSYLSLK